jgi:hypothetical protein
MPDPDDRVRRDDFEDGPPLPRRRREREDDEDDDDRPRRSRDVRASRMSIADLRGVATSQKAIIWCILGNLATLPLRFVLNELPPTLQLAGFIGLIVFYLAVGITATVFVFLLAVKVYSTGTGVALGILTLLPCIGLIVLLIINSKATGILQRNGVRVGLLGANMSDLARLEEDEED